MIHLLQIKMLLPNIGGNVPKHHGSAALPGKMLKKKKVTLWIILSNIHMDIQTTKLSITSFLLKVIYWGPMRKETVNVDRHVQTVKRELVSRHRLSRANHFAILDLGDLAMCTFSVVWCENYSHKTQMQKLLHVFRFPIVQHLRYKVLLQPRAQGVSSLGFYL